MEAAQPRRLIRLPEVAARTGVSIPRIYSLMAVNRFPISVTTGVNSRAWVESEVDEWVQARIDARNTGADADWRVINPHIGRGRPHQAATRGTDAVPPDPETAAA